MSIKVYAPQEVYKNGEFNRIEMRQDDRLADGWVKKYDYDSLKKDFEEMVRFYGDIDSYTKNSTDSVFESRPIYNVMSGDYNGNDLGVGDFKKQSVSDLNVAGKLAREMAEKYGVKV